MYFLSLEQWNLFWSSCRLDNKSDTKYFVIPNYGIFIEQLTEGNKQLSEITSSFLDNSLIWDN